ALPSEHGGWGLLLEAVILGMVVRPSWSGALIGATALFLFLARHPLKLALQDALRGRRAPRTAYCWGLTSGYLMAAVAALSIAVMVRNVTILIPLGLLAPLAVTQILYDAHNRSRELLPELSAAAVMPAFTAAIAIAGGVRIIPAFALGGLLLARSVPSILYVRTILRGLPVGPAVVAHVLALALAALFAPWLAVVAMAILLLRALWGLTRPAPPAKTIGWREMIFGAITIGLIAFGHWT
ncbi:MAG TPA: YwiC-like family protein, partial [Thermoanaerobaculia bacterium]|nr:YwiC-like family protein [Thermoanaerobaculia bacterium]